MFKKEKKNILVALAWPYANGSLHLGHIASFIGADILARYHRQKGDDVLFVSGSDCYGTPIALEALARGVKPQEIAERYHKEFAQNLIDDLHFSYDLYSKTTDPHHTKLVQEFFLALHKKGHIYIKEENALYSEELQRFLPDRFVQGECECGCCSATGDQCDECGTLLDTLQLKNPRINKKAFPNMDIENTPLVVRKTEQFHLRLSAFQEQLEVWVESASDEWRPYAERFTKSFVKQGLRDRAITRDTDWGVPIPIAGYEDKRIYVWFEAVLGYLSASQQQQAEDWVRWWQNPDAVHYYVHGKDNVPFHTVILPAMLMAHGDLHLPDKVFASEYLSLEGKQFSTSRSYAVWVPEFLEDFDSELLRYFLVVQGTETSDIDFRWDNFAELVNGELIGTFGNFINRVCAFTKKNFPEGVIKKKSLSEEAETLLAQSEKAFTTIGEYIEKGMFRKAFREVLQLAEQGNRYIHSHEPWSTITTDSDQAETDLFVLLTLTQTLAVLVEPFLPKTSKSILSFMQNETAVQWGAFDAQQKITVSEAVPLFKRVEPEDVQKQKEKLGIV